MTLRFAPRRDVLAPTMTDNQTWNNCSHCGAEWPDQTPTPGVLHRTTLCDRCRSSRGGKRRPAERLR